MDLRALTESYVAAFDGKDLGAVATLLAPDFALEDPVVVRVEGRDACLAAIRGIFDGNPSLAFRARRILVDGDTSVIEFVLTLGETMLKGTDVIEWRDGLMREMRAYLDIPKE